MKKIILLLGFMFLFACKSDITDIKQDISVVDRENNTYSVTTYFTQPYNYNAYVVCASSDLDSIKEIQMLVAKHVQKYNLQGCDVNLLDCKIVDTLNNNALKDTTLKK